MCKRLLLVSFLIISATVSNAFCQSGRDSLSLDTATSKAGALVKVPIRLKDAFGTTLGVDAGAGNQIQGFSVKVSVLPADYVDTVSIDRSGALASLTPLYEYKNSMGNMATLVTSFDEASQPVPGLYGEGSEIATLSVQISNAAKPYTALLHAFDKQKTLISNQAGTNTESTLYSQIDTTDGSVNITKGSSKPVLSIKVLKIRGTESGKAAKFRISRSGSAASQLKSKISIMGQAKNGKDFKKISTSVVFPKRVSRKDISISPIKDKLKEAVETVTVSISSSRAYSVMAPGRVTLLISEK